MISGQKVDDKGELFKQNMRRMIQAVVPPWVPQIGRVANVLEDAQEMKPRAYSGFVVSPFQKLLQAGTGIKIRGSLIKDLGGAEAADRIVQLASRMLGVDPKRFPFSEEDTRAFDKDTLKTAIMFQTNARLDPKNHNQILKSYAFEKMRAGLNHKEDKSSPEIRKFGEQLFQESVRMFKEQQAAELRLGRTAFVRGATNQQLINQVSRALSLHDSDAFFQNMGIRGQVGSLVAMAAVEGVPEKDIVDLIRKTLMTQSFRLRSTTNPEDFEDAVQILDEYLRDPQTRRARPEFESLRMMLKFIQMRGVPTNLRRNFLDENRRKAMRLLGL